MRVFNEDDDPYILRIKPEGWTEELIFDLKHYHSCGEAEAGLGIRTSKSRGGGVLNLDDLIAISDAISRHFRRISKDLGNGVGFSIGILDELGDEEPEDV